MSMYAEQLDPIWKNGNRVHCKMELKFLTLEMSDGENLKRTLSEKELHIYGLGHLSHIPNGKTIMDIYVWP